MVAASPLCIRALYLTANAAIGLMCGFSMVTACGVPERTSRVRMALGAGTIQVLEHIVGEGRKAALIGMAVGLPGACFVGKIMRSQLYNVAPIDGLRLIAVTVVLLAALRED